MRPRSAATGFRAPGRPLRALERRRLQLHPVNLAASAGEDGNVVLSGSLLADWAVPRIVDGAWFLKMLNGLPGAGRSESDE